MPQSLDTTFSTRREAELAVEHLVQAHAIDRTSIVVGPEGSQNSAGDTRSGSDDSAESPTHQPRDDAALNGPILVSVHVNDSAEAATVRAAVIEAGGALA